jgi:hypothetical protein
MPPPNPNSPAPIHTIAVTVTTNPAFIPDFQFITASSFGSLLHRIVRYNTWMHERKPCADCRSSFAGGSQRRASGSATAPTSRPPWRLLVEGRGLTRPPLRFTSRPFPGPGGRNASRSPGTTTRADSQHQGTRSSRSRTERESSWAPSESAAAPHRSNPMDAESTVHHGAPREKEQSPPTESSHDYEAVRQAVP